MLHAVTAMWRHSFLIGALAVLMLSAFFMLAPPAHAQLAVGVTSSLRPLSSSPRMPLDTPTRTPTNTPDPCAPVWSVVTSVNVSTGNNYLRAVSAVSANDVWAVGGYYMGSAYQTLVDH